jgi:hypothetical protein
MNVETKYRLRVETCIGTIIDVHKRIKGEYEHLDFISQFETLRKAVEHLDMSLVSEGDILMVEQATNALLEEFGTLFKSAQVGQVYDGPHQA